MKLIKRLGLSYAWGLANFTLGAALGGIYVAAILLSNGAVR